MLQTINLGRVACNPRGVYDNAATYNRLDVVSYGGNGWICVSNNVSGNAPNAVSQYWKLILDNSTLDELTLDLLKLGSNEALITVTNGDLDVDATGDITIENSDSSIQFTDNNVVVTTPNGELVADQISVNDDLWVDGNATIDNITTNDLSSPNATITDLDATRINLAGTDLGTSLTALDNKIKVDSSDSSNADYAVADENGNVIVELNGGGIRTKNFNSTNVSHITKNGDVTTIDTGQANFTGDIYAPGCEIGCGTVTAEVVDSEQVIAEDITADSVTTDSITLDGQDLSTLISQLPSEVPVTVSNVTPDWALADESGNALIECADGHIKTKNFDSDEVTTSIADLESSVSTMQEQIAEAGIGAVEVLDTSSNDFFIADASGNAIVEFKNGHIITKEFDSSDINIPEYTDLQGKTVAFLGDSITAGYELTDRSKVYHKLFADMTGCINRNLGSGGSSIAQRRGSDNNRFRDRATVANLSDASLIVVFGGTNDFDGNNYPIGDLFERSNNNINPPSNTAAFGGALHELILLIKQNAPCVPIMFITPCNRGAYLDRRTTRQLGTSGNSMDEYREAITKICAFYSIPVLHLEDISQLDFADTSVGAMYSKDNLHPNEVGNMIIAKALYNFVKNKIII